MVNEMRMMNKTSDPDHTCGDTDPVAPSESTNAVTAAEIPGAAPGKTLSPEAIRALKEAEARRSSAPASDLPPESNGRGGEEPTRYGDWERKGLAVDF
jgi:hypothetical protein